jgi:chaperonin GroES
MKAIKDTVIIEPITHIELPSGIFLSAKETENPTGIVKSAGEGTKNNPMTIKDGDTVTYRADCGHDLEHENVKYLVLKEHHIIGIN